VRERELTIIYAVLKNPLWRFDLVPPPLPPTDEKGRSERGDLTRAGTLSRREMCGWAEVGGGLEWRLNGDVHTERARV